MVKLSFLNKSEQKKLQKRKFCDRIRVKFKIYRQTTWEET